MRRSRRAPVGEPAREDVAVLAQRLGTSVPDDLLHLALTHRSFAYENGGLPTNERLEFLGDSVLGLVVTERLYRDNPDLSEADLARMRAATVSQPPLAQIAREHGVGDFVKLGRGELVTGGREKDSILSDTVEALIGAVYLTHGLEPTRTVVERLVAGFLVDARRRGVALDWKSALQDHATATGLESPAYDVRSEGPPHAPSFHADVLVAGEIVGGGDGRTKKAAEREAARDALEHLGGLPGEGETGVTGGAVGAKASVGGEDSRD